MAVTASLDGYTFTGREWDKETGLYYYRARYYDPMEGRFISKDPIGFSGGINLYSYTAENPINYTDPFGLDRYKFCSYAPQMFEKVCKKIADWACGRNPAACCESELAGCMGDIDCQDPNYEIKMNQCRTLYGQCVLEFGGAPDPKNSPPPNPYPETRTPSSRDTVKAR